jgi:hypothetical protein
MQSQTLSDDNEETADSGEKWHPLAFFVANGKTIKDATEELGIPERTAYRYSGLPEFKRRVSEIRTEALDAATGEITAAATVAVATIRELLGSTNEPSVRLNAAKAIINAMKPLSELGELRQRIAALEADR